MARHSQPCLPHSCLLVSSYVQLNKLGFISALPSKESPHYKASFSPDLFLRNWLLQINRIYDFLKQQGKHRSFSIQMSQLYDYGDDGEFETVIAAAAYAIVSLEEEEDEGSLNRKRSAKRLGTSLSRTKSKNEDDASMLTGVGVSFKRWFTGQPKEDAKLGGSKRFGSAKEMSSEPIAPAAKPTSFGSRSWNRHPAEKSKADMEADAWEKEKMIKINERYNKMISTIAEWVNEKKAKAKLRLERYKNGPERKRARALQEYQNAIARIDKVGGEARALAEERKRNDESKMRMKAKEIRSTGKVPQPSCCRCF